jgi:hypothetical protein
MSGLGQISLTWGPGEYTFRLRIKELIELDEIVGAGPQFILQALSDGTWRVAMVRETVRLGLIGGGLKPTEASKLVVRYVDERPLLESVMHAQAILAAALIGRPEEDAAKKPKAAKGKQAKTDA